MKRRHRIPPEAYFTSDPITPQYQAEVDRSMARAAQREHRAQRRLAAAEEQLRKAQRVKPVARRAGVVSVALELVELRRQELLEVQRAMGAVPSGAAHRGEGHGKRPVPGMRTI